MSEVGFVLFSFNWHQYLFNQIINFCDHKLSTDKMEKSNAKVLTYGIVKIIEIFAEKC